MIKNTFQFKELMQLLTASGTTPACLHTNLKQAMAIYTASDAFTQLPAHKRQQIAIEHTIITSIFEKLNEAAR